jgi:ATP-dependent exoDNAse (exonuclease V) beta subunit
MEDSFFDENYAHELEAAYMDNINLLYVAFTRAEEQLYICSNVFNEEDEDATPNVSRLLKHVLATITSEGMSYGDNLFTYGGVRETIEKKQQDVLSKDILPAVFGNFKEKIKLVSREEYNTAQVKGNLMHTIMSKVYRAGHLDKAVQATVKEYASRDIYKAQAEKIIQLFEENGWFDVSWKHINERAIWFEGKEIRPDKVLLSDSSCIILDYKTGAHESEHIQQMQAYAKAYASFYTQKIIPYLIYIEDMQLNIKEVS